MQPTASSSKSSSAFFKQLPLEPFTNLRWHVQQPTSTAPHVVLIINAPRDVAELFRHDPFDEDSLFLIATHTKLHLQDIHNFPPYIRVLRMKEPVTTALLLASLLERASTVVRKWSPAEPRLFELVESPEGEFLPANGAPRISHRRNSVSSLFRTQPSASKTKINRPFDALINFLPETLSEKSLLKHAILTTTLSQSFLSSNASDHVRKPSSHSHASSSVSLASNASASSIFRGIKRPGSVIKSRDSIKASSASMSRLSTHGTINGPAGSKGRPHLVHVLPRVNYSQKNLVSSIEHFLATFSNNASSLASPSSAPAGAGKRHHSLPSPPPLVQSTGTVPYLIRPDVLFSCPAPYFPPNPSPYSQNQGNKTVFHLVLTGCLDPTTSYNHPMKSYISSLRDITYEPAETLNGAVSADVYPSPPPSTNGLRTPPTPEPAKPQPRASHVPHYRLSRTVSMAQPPPPPPSRPLSEGSDSILGSGLGWYKKPPKSSDKGKGKTRDVSVSGLPTPPDSSDSSDEGTFPSALRRFQQRSQAHTDESSIGDTLDRSGESKRSKLRNRLAFWKR